MFKHFRKFRSMFAGEGKLRGYLLYAVGEILLVMLGILLALQVNNWNEQRKSLNKARSHLSALKKDLQLDLAQLKANEDYLNSYEKAGLNVWNYLYDTGVPADSSSVNRDFLRVQLFREFSPTKVAYDNLVNTGGISLLGNANLQRLLATYYFETPFAMRAKEQRNRLAIEYDPFRIKYIPPGMLREYLKEAVPGMGYSDFDASEYPIAWDNIRNDDNYRLLLDQILAMRIPARYRIERTRGLIAELITEIDKELQSGD